MRHTLPININNIKKANGVSILNIFHLLKKEENVSLNLTLNVLNQEKQCFTGITVMKEIISEVKPSDCAVCSALWDISLLRHVKEVSL